jgi:hypothetical protein
MVPVNNNISSYSIDHNKYALFSKVSLPRGIAKNVVFSTSHNFIKGATKRLNDAVVMSGERLYKAFLNDWKQVAKYAQGGMKNFTYHVSDLDSMKAIFFPRRKNGKWDGHGTIVYELNKLSDYTQDTVRVLMARWTRVNEAEKLTDLEKKGVTVQVITRSHTSAVSDRVTKQLSLLKKAGGYVKFIDGRKEGTDHSKTMLVKGTWNGRKQRIILTGSYNYGIATLKSSNNFLLILKDSVLFKDYWFNFDEVKKMF